MMERDEVAVGAVAGAMNDGRGKPLGPIRGGGGSKGLENPTGTSIVREEDGAGGLGRWL